MLKLLTGLTICLLVTACASVGGPDSEDKSLLSLFYVSKPAKAQALSPWYYESLAYCRIESEDELALFKLPQRVDIWDRIREGFSLREENRKDVQQQIKWLVEHPQHLNEISSRATPYLYHIVERLHERDMPLEIALLPIVESAFDPFAYSHGRAAGMWQVIPNTGEALGLKQNWWYDGRRDVVASTDAALNYLQQLNRRFDGDWLLTFAAYNAGQGTVARAIRKNQSTGLPTDYWSLPLPQETRHYVPKLLAIKTLINRPENYGLALTTIPNTPFFETVDIGSQIDLTRAAELAGLKMEEFHALNPGFNRWATDPEGPHVLLVPAEKSEEFKQKIALLSPEDRMVWDRYKIRKGDTLIAIAKRYETTVGTLQNANRLEGNNIRIGNTLLVPLQAKRTIGSTRLAHVGAAPKPEVGQEIQYKVQKGDTLWSIARRFEVSPKDLAKWNKLGKKEAIFPGQALAVRQESVQVAKQTTQTVKRLNYKVRRGDTLTRIAGKFNVRVADIVEWNQVKPGNYLQPGDLLTLFVDVTKAQP